MKAVKTAKVIIYAKIQTVNNGDVLDFAFTISSLHSSKEGDFFPYDWLIVDTMTHFFKGNCTQNVVKAQQKPLRGSQSEIKLP